MFLFFVQKIKSLVLLFVSVVRRAFCCFRRRRRQSKDEPLSNIVVSDNAQQELEQWNDWEFKNRKPASVEEHIEYYRQQQAKLRQQQTVAQPAPEEVEQDLFTDMSPQITKQAKVVIGQVENEKYNRNSLSLQAADDFVTNELGNWDENSGWEADAMDAGELLRQKKREERERRHLEQQQKRAEKTNRPNLGARITT